MEENILDFANLRCRQHPLQILTNYCANEQCLVALCSQCVCTHTQMHMKECTQPQYKPLKQIHRNIHSQISSRINLLESDKDRIMRLMKKISQRRSNYKILIIQTKNQVMKLIQNTFMQLQNQFQEQVKIQCKRTGLHSSFQIQSLCRKVNRQISTLVSEAQLLNSNKFLQLIKTVKNNTFNEVTKVRTEILNQLKENQQFNPSLQYKRQYLSEIQSTIKNLLTQRFTYPRISYKPRVEPTLIKQAFNTSQGFYKPKQKIQQQNMMKTDGFTYSIPQYPVDIDEKTQTNWQGMRNSSLAHSQKLNAQIPKNEKSTKTIMRSNSSNSINYFNQIPQFYDVNNFPFNFDPRKNEFSDCKRMTMTGSRVFIQTTNRR